MSKDIAELEAHIARQDVAMKSLQLNPALMATAFGQVDAFRALVAELVVEIEHAEWRGWSEDGAVCPRCERYPPGDLQNLGGHAPGCTLAAALAKARGQP